MFHQETTDVDKRLDSTDAQFVDVIHTAGLWIGLDENVRMIKTVI